FAGLSLGAAAAIGAAGVAALTALYLLKLQRRRGGVPLAPLWGGVLGGRQAQRASGRARAALSPAVSPRVPRPPPPGAGPPAPRPRRSRRRRRADPGRPLGVDGGARRAGVASRRRPAARARARRRAPRGRHRDDRLLRLGRLRRDVVRARPTPAARG